VIDTRIDPALVVETLREAQLSLVWIARHLALPSTVTIEATSMADRIAKVLS
jgi:hypothetical protein